MGGAMTPLRLATLGVAALSVVGCAATAPTGGQFQQAVASSDVAQGLLAESSFDNALKTPALIAVDYNIGALQYWPIHNGGNNHPIIISKSGLFGYGGLVAHGRVIVGLTKYPPALTQYPAISVYDLSTKGTKTLPDPNGTPFDIAIGKDLSLYVINSTKGPTNVTWYPGGSATPKKLVCGVQDASASIAVDNEGDIFMNGYSENNLAVAEIPNGPGGPEPKKCHLLQLNPEYGSATGIAIDPKTDALITLEDPGDCAGGEEGRMTIYPKPYNPHTSQWHDIGQNCSFSLRLNADSTIVFTLDQDVSGGSTYIIEASYPDGVFLGTFHGGQPYGYITVPNTLPN
jgi:hypothetical protein